MKLYFGVLYCFYLIVFSSCAGLKAGLKKGCVNYSTPYCIGPNVEQICETKDECQHCYCRAKSGEQLYPNQYLHN